MPGILRGAHIPVRPFTASPRFSWPDAALWLNQVLPNVAALDIDQ